MKVHGPIGPFQQDFLMWMDVSPRNDVVYARHHEAPRELWMLKLR